MANYARQRAIGYAMRARERELEKEYLNIRDLFLEFIESKYKSMLWFIRSKGLQEDYNGFKSIKQK